MLTPKIVYMAGPITGLSYSGSTNWRILFKNLLKSTEDLLVGLSPLRAKDYLAEELEIKDHYAEHPLSSQRGITTRDRNDVMNCDLLLVNLLGAKTVSIGTVMEIAWADMLRKPIVLVIEKEGNLHDHAMIREVTGYRVESLADALPIIKAILLP